MRPPMHLPISRFLSLLLSLLLVSFHGNAQNQPSANIRNYIEKYKALAMTEQLRTGMPAAIKLAQGLYETGAGTSELATRANNHFGMKCKRNWTGETYTYTDDAKDECFRKYPTAEASYRDQGDYLKGNPRYADCFALDVKDYRGWAIQLRKAGYATNPAYSQKLIKTIEDNNLQQYTLQALGETTGEAEVIPENDKPAGTTSVGREDLKEAWTETKQLPLRLKEALKETFRKTPEGQIETYKNLQGFYGVAGQSLLEEAQRYNVRYAKLLEWNDLPDAPLPYDMFVYLERKPARTTGNDRHRVQAGETLHRIAQEEAIQLQALRMLNMLDPGEEPAEGTLLLLQNTTAVKPATYRPEAIEALKKAAEANANRSTSGWVAKEDLETPSAQATQPAMAVSIDKMPVIPEPGWGLIAEPIAPQTETPVLENNDSVIHAASENTVTAVNTEVSSPISTAPKEPETPPTDTPPEPAKPVYEDNALGRLKAKMDHAVYTKAPATPSAATVSAPVKSSIDLPKPAANAIPELPSGNARPEYHLVKKGDTVFSIAKQYGVSVTELRTWNKMDNFAAMRTGQRLKLKP